MFAIVGYQSKQKYQRKCIGKIQSRSNIFNGIEALSTNPAPLHLVLDPLRHKLTDVMM